MMWLLGESRLSDEMMMRFKGNHKDKKQITYKAEGDSFHEIYHKCTMDNLNNSASFCCTAFNHRKKVLCQGITCKVMHGNPPPIIQEEKKKHNDQICACGTVKAV
eukprot:12109836-Ditylum_brightwellii.AAC.1